MKGVTSMSRIVSLSHDQLNFLLDVARAGDGGLVVQPSNEGVPSMPAGIVEMRFHGGWRFTLAPRGREMVAAVRKKDAS